MAPIEMHADGLTNQLVCLSVHDKLPGMQTEHSSCHITFNHLWRVRFFQIFS